VIILKDRTFKKELFKYVGVSTCLSLFIYLVYGNTGIVKTKLDVIYFNVLVIIPFILPVMDIIYNKKYKKGDF